MAKKKKKVAVAKGKMAAKGKSVDDMVQERMMMKQNEMMMRQKEMMKQKEMMMKKAKMMMK